MKGERMKKIVLAVAVAAMILMLTVPVFAGALGGNCTKAEIKGHTVYVGEQQADVTKDLGEPDGVLTSPMYKDEFNFYYGKYFLTIKNGVVTGITDTTDTSTMSTLKKLFF